MITGLTKTEIIIKIIELKPNVRYRKLFNYERSKLLRILRKLEKENLK